MVKTKINIYKNWNNHKVVSDRIVRGFKRDMKSSEFMFRPIPSEILSMAISNNINNIDSIQDVNRYQIMNALQKMLSTGIVCWICTHKSRRVKKIVLSTQIGELIHSNFFNII